METNGSAGIRAAELAEWVRQQAAKILKVPAGELRPEARWVDDLEADSLDMSELAATVEREFRVRIEDAELVQTSTVRETCDLIWNCLNEVPAGPAEAR